MKSFVSILVFLFAATALMSCTKKSSETNYQVQETGFTCTTKNFTFDKVEAYSISLSALDVIEEKSNKTDNDKFLLQLTNTYITDNLKNTDSTKLTAAGFTQKIIDKENYPDLCALFQEQYVYQDTMACQPVFRDILLFKEKQRLTGVAKICYTCGHSVVLLGDSTKEVNVYRLDALLN